MDNEAIGGRHIDGDEVHAGFHETGAAARESFSAQAAKGKAQVLPVIAEIQVLNFNPVRFVASG